MKTCLSSAVVLLALAGEEVRPAGINRAIEAPKALDVRVLIQSPRGNHLRSELVQITAVLENSSPTEFVIRDNSTVALEDQGVSVAREGQPFQQFIVRSLGWDPGFQMTLSPGERWTAQFRVLSSPAARGDGSPFLPGGLAFPRPGIYRVKVVCPLVLGAPTDPSLIESNIIAIRVREPKGIDAQVWRRLRDADTLRFLQFGWTPAGREEFLGTMTAVLEEFPTSGYGPALRYALRKAYPQWSHYPEEDRERIRRLVGLSPEIASFHPTDERLDARVTVDVPAGGTVDQVLASLSRQAGMTLRATPRMGRRVYTGPRRGTDLRTLMKEMAQAQPGWWAGGDRDLYTLWSLEELNEGD